MSTLTVKRCVTHFAREAAVRCPECLLFYCRECVTEHQGRMICARCVARHVAVKPAKGSSAAIWALFSAAGLLFTWMVFYYAGMALARIPSSFHGAFS